MPREYRHIKQYEKEMLELREKGATRQEIADKFGFTKEQVHEFLRGTTETNASLRQE